jgi:lipopolysaccharide export system protein LptA
MKAQGRLWIRRITAALIVVSVAGLVALGVQRSRELTKPTGGEREREIADARPDDPAVGVYTGFEYVETIAGRAIFALRSLKTLGRSSGWHEIEGVQLQLYDAGVAGPIVTAAGASFNVETRDAELRGPIHVSFPGGATITTESGHFEASSRRFVTDSEVVFTNGTTVAEAGHAMYLMSDDRLVLGDGALLISGGATLEAPTIEYQRGRQIVEFPEGCRIIEGGAWIAAPYAIVDLVDPEGPPRRISFRGGVKVRDPGDGARGASELSAESLVAERDGHGNWQIDASTTGDWASVTFRLGGAFHERRLRTRILRGVVGPDGPLNMRAEDGVCLEEIPIEGEPRSAEASTARVWFKNGQATDVELEQQVVIRGEHGEATGRRARFSAVSGITMLHGDPGGIERAAVTSPRGRITCDQVQMHDRQGRLEARGNVQGTLNEVAVLGGDAADPAAPMHFAAELLEITQSGAGYRLRDGARLWQGENLLTADDVSYRRSGELLEASGHVRATVPSSQLDRGDAGDGQVVIVARSLSYSRLGGDAVFRGDVRYSDPDNLLTATELSAAFDDQNRIRRIEALGNVELRELATGRTMTAQRAVRDVELGTVHATGSPVRLVDATGSAVSSSSLTWNQADGSVTVAGGTETIYYPQEEP